MGKAEQLLGYLIITQALGSLSPQVNTKASNFLWNCQGTESIIPSAIVSAILPPVWSSQVKECLRSLLANSAPSGSMKSPLSQFGYYSRLCSPSEDQPRSAKFHLSPNQSVEANPLLMGDGGFQCICTDRTFDDVSGIEHSKMNGTNLINLNSDTHVART